MLLILRVKVNACLYILFINLIYLSLLPPHQAFHSLHLSQCPNFLEQVAYSTQQDSHSVVIIQFSPQNWMTRGQRTSPTGYAILMLETFINFWGRGFNCFSLR